MTLLALILLSLVTYRVTRFVSLDSLIEEPRDWVERRLLSKGHYTQDDEDWPVGYFRRKALQWLRCPYCQSVWFAAGAVGFMAWVTDYTMTWMWLVDWLAVAAGAMIIYRYTDPSPPCLPTKKCD